MRIGLGVDQLGIDADPVVRTPDAAFQDITHTKLAPDLPCVDSLVPVGERGIARDHEHSCEPRQIGRQILGDAVREILSLGVVAQIAKGERTTIDKRGATAGCGIAMGSGELDLGRPAMASGRKS
jgi:hypothetical protein